MTVSSLRSANPNPNSNPNPNQVTVSSLRSVLMKNDGQTGNAQASGPYSRALTQALTRVP